jgi:hypothetical protein
LEPNKLLTSHQILMISHTNHLDIDKTDESVICIDSDSSDSVIYVESKSSSPKTNGRQGSSNDRLDQRGGSFNDRFNQRNRTIIQRPAESYSSSDSGETEDLNGFEIIRRLDVAMESFVHISDRERNKRFWQSNVVRDFKSYLYSVDQRLRRFVKDPMKPDMIILNSIPKRLWNFIIDQSAFYGIHVQSRGSNQNEYLSCYRNRETYLPKGYLRRLDSVIFEKVNNTWRFCLGKKRTLVDLDPATSKGYQMLIKMGWQPGTPLGIRDGILEPISINNGRCSKSGLGTVDYF